MKRSTRRSAALSTAVVLGLSLSACGASNEDGGNAGGTAASGGASSGPALSGTLNGVGSSAQQAAVQAWSSAFQGANSGVTVNYDAAGSGAGRTQFTKNGADFAGSDAYMKPEELTAADKRCNGGTALDVPVYVSPIAVVYNLPAVKNIQLSPETLAGLMLGTITTWDDPKVKADNPDADLPSTKVTPVHRSDDSGTTQNFTDYLHATAPAVWTAEPAQKWPVASGEAAAKTSGMVATVQGGAGTIGYADESQAGELGQAKIKVGATYAAPSAEGAAKALEASPVASGRPAGDVAVTIDRKTTADGAYPVFLVSYQIFCTKYADAAKAALVKGFLGYVVSEQGQQAAAQAAKSAPLPAALRDKAAQSVASIAAA